MTEGKFYGIWNGKSWTQEGKMAVDSDEDVPITKYIVARKASVYDLEVAVSVLADEGYIPVGGLCVYRTAAQCLIFAQAMAWRPDD